MNENGRPTPTRREVKPLKKLLRPWTSSGRGLYDGGKNSHLHSVLPVNTESVKKAFPRLHDSASWPGVSSRNLGNNLFDGLCTYNTGRMGWMSHWKWKETKQQPSMLPGPAVSGCCFISFHFLWAIHPIHPVQSPDFLGDLTLCRKCLGNNSFGGAVLESPS